jgi:hypothetical protein
MLKKKSLPRSEIQGIKLPGGKDGEYIESKLCMFADDTQLFNKNDESVQKKTSEQYLFYYRFGL